jgi:hypothetical protein
MGSLHGQTPKNRRAPLSGRQAEAVPFDWARLRSDGSAARRYQGPRRPAPGPRWPVTRSVAAPIVCSQESADHLVLGSHRRHRRVDHRGVEQLMPRAGCRGRRLFGAGGAAAIGRGRRGRCSQRACCGAPAAQRGYAQPAISDLPFRPDAAGTMVLIPACRTAEDLSPAARSPRLKLPFAPGTDCRHAGHRGDRIVNPAAAEFSGSAPRAGQRRVATCG